jgi:hypothetical protein
MLVPLATNVPMSVTDFEAIKAFVIQEKVKWWL